MEVHMQSYYYSLTPKYAINATSRSDIYYVLGIFLFIQKLCSILKWYDSYQSASICIFICGYHKGWTKVLTVIFSKLSCSNLAGHIVHTFNGYSLLCIHTPPPPLPVKDLNCSHTHLPWGYQWKWSSLQCHIILHVTHLPWPGSGELWVVLLLCRLHPLKHSRGLLHHATSYDFTSFDPVFLHSF